MGAERRIRIEASALDDEGRGVGLAGDRDVSVADLLPGERAEVAIEHMSPHAARAWGRVVRRSGPASPDRAEPACPAFGECGGCALQHLAYPAQLAHKRRVVSRALSRALGPAAPAVADTRPSPKTLGYRSRAKYVAAPQGDTLTLGAFAPRSHRVVETLGCRVVEPVVGRVARATTGALAETSLSIYDEVTRAGELRYAIVRSGTDDTALVGIVTTSDARQGEVARAGDALVAHPEVCGVVWIRNDLRSGGLLTEDIAPLAGRTTVVDEVGPTTADIDVTAFTQVNREQARRLYLRAAELAEVRAGARAVELYCGAGAIALHLAEAGAQVVGVERHEPAVAIARRAADAAGLGDRARFRAADAADYLAHADAGAEDVLVVDPPRKGLSAEARAAIARAPARSLLYMSCNPQSFARDAAALAPSYALELVEPWDLMPGTPQVEILARFSRRGPAGPSREA